MKKPTLRVTKWLGNIPVEASCTFCSAAFKAQSSGHRPDLVEYQKSLRAQFDEHCKLAHGDGAERGQAGS